MLEEVLRYLEPAPGRVIADLTLGGAGHTLSFLEAGAKVIGFDRDAEALARARQRLKPHSDRFVPMHRDFGSLPEALDECGHQRVDGVLMDLGLSSDQLDDDQRGFAFRLDGPLDLRFDTTQGAPAWQLLEEADEHTMVKWLSEFGEVRVAKRLAKVLAGRAKAGELRTTTSLREAVESVVVPRHRPQAELARVFQALRILVNEELIQLDRVLASLEERLNSGGRFVAISYHSLEDRRVKSMIRSKSRQADTGSRHLPPVPGPAPTFRALTTKVVKPTESEIARNPRARSARLRAAERLA